MSLIALCSLVSIEQFTYNAMPFCNAITFYDAKLSIMLCLSVMLCFTIKLCLSTDPKHR